MNRKLLILGCGYSAIHISKILISRGWDVFGTVRSKQNFEKLSNLGINPIFWDDMSVLANVLSEDCSLLSSIPPRGSIDDGLDKLRILFADGRVRVDWLGYLSSTGVYGDRMGGWVNEESAADTVTAQGLARVSAEKDWFNLALKQNIPLFIFRVAGIYGPLRNVFDRIKTGTAQKVVKPDQYFNRIHVDDLAGAVCCTLTKSDLAGIYNITDDLPTSGPALMDEATRLMGISPLPEVNFSCANLSTMARSFYKESKRVSNKKFTSTFGYSLKFPTYVSGLKSIFDKRV